jgi:hypothetical protein
MAKIQALAFGKIGVENSVRGDSLNLSYEDLKGL